MDLNITLIWVPNNNTPGDVSVEVIPNVLYLTPNESELIYVKVTGQELGEYSGSVEFTPDIVVPENFTGIGGFIVPG